MMNLTIRRRVEFWSAIIQILTDLTNLIEQLVIFFIVKEESQGDKYQQRLFFFVLLVIGLLSCIPPVIRRCYLQTIGSISIEFGELMAYLFLLRRSTKVILVALGLFCVEFILHMAKMILDYCFTETKEDIGVFGKSAWGRIKYVGLRLAMYSIFDATSLLFLFLDDSSRFHHTFYEILILLTFYFPSIALDPALESITRFKHEYKQGRVPRVTILLVWSLFCANIYFLMYCVPLSITGVVFAVQELRETTKWYGYDFAVYISSLIFFTIAIIVFLPFTRWQYRITIQEFITMRRDAKQKLERSKHADYTYDCLATS